MPSENILASYVSSWSMEASPSVSRTTSRVPGLAPGGGNQSSGGTTHTQMPRVQDEVVFPTVKSPCPPQSWLSKNDFPVRYIPATATVATGAVPSARSKSSPSSCTRRFAPSWLTSKVGLILPAASSMAVGTGPASAATAATATIGAASGVGAGAGAKKSSIVAAQKKEPNYKLLVAAGAAQSVLFYK